uniref:PE-PGRS family protein n=1 Tax=Anisakis simplex TaxID=6269 RepID=A0A0M3JAK9_ANISI
LLQNAQNASLAAPNTTLGTQLNALATLLQSSGQPNVLSLLGNGLGWGGIAGLRLQLGAFETLRQSGPLRARNCSRIPDPTFT